MKLLKVSFDNIKMFKDDYFEMDFFAEDRVLQDDESVYELKKTVYTNNVIALSGINGSGKTVSLSLLSFATDVLCGATLQSIIENDKALANLLGAQTEMRMMFWHQDVAYILVSKIEREQPKGIQKKFKNNYVFSDEELYVIPASKVTKSFLKQSFDEIIQHSNLTCKRSEVISKEHVYLPDDLSILATQTLKSSRGSLGLFQSEFPFMLIDEFGGLDEVLRAFDSNIEHLEIMDKGRVYELKLANNPEPILTNEEGIIEILSSGTLKGLAVVQVALIVLKMGGYLLLDEIENHLNHQLVKLIIDLFDERQTNPFGATLVFTTHYAEVLDHLHRKDCVYFLARHNEGKDAGKSSLVKYSSRVRRIENKKSEVFISNYIKGTAPRYKDIRALKDYAKNAVASVDEGKSYLDDGVANE